MTIHKRHVLAAALVLAVASLLIPVTAVAQEAAVKAEKLPEARKIIDKFIDASGGEKTIRKIKSMEMAGEFEMPQMGITGTLKVQAMAPNMTAVTVEIPAMGTMREGFNGEIAWALDATTGPRLKEGDALVQAKFESDFYSTLHADERYKSMETLEKTDVDGTAAYKLRLVTRDDREVFEYYAVDTGLLVASEQKMATPMGEILAMTKPSEYREYGGMQIPTKLVVETGPMKQILNFSEISLDSVDASAFELPPEIKVLTEE